MLLSKVHGLGESLMRLPLGGGTRSSLLQHLVDLLKGKTLGLRDEEVCEQERDAAKATPHELQIVR